VIPLPISQDEARAMLPTGHPLGRPGQTLDPRTREWIIHDLVPIRRSEALAEMPWLRRPHVWRNPETGVVYRENDKHYYRCTLFDPATRRCTAHDTRPDTCRGYPWYGADKLGPEKALPPGCEFHLDRGEPVDREWQPVTLRRAADG
jgi:hypothetical protein